MISRKEAALQHSICRQISASSFHHDSFRFNNLCNYVSSIAKKHTVAWVLRGSAAMLVEGRIWVGACISWVFQVGLLLAGATWDRRLKVIQKECSPRSVMKNLHKTRWLCGSPFMLVLDSVQFVATTVVLLGFDGARTTWIVLRLHKPS